MVVDSIGGPLRLGDVLYKIYLNKFQHEQRGVQFGGGGRGGGGGGEEGGCGVVVGSMMVSMRVWDKSYI